MQDMPGALIPLSLAVWFTPGPQRGDGDGIGRVLASARARTAFNRSMAGLLVLSLAAVFW